MVDDATHSTRKGVHRMPVLAAANGDALTAISIAPLEASARFSLRLRAASTAELGKSDPFRFDMPVNTCIVEDGRTIARLGPDEWILLDSDAQGESLAREVDAALAGKVFSRVDISHRNVGIVVAGIHAREVINGGCPLDLHDTAFPPYSATRTIFGKAEIILIRPSVQATYRVECWRSFAPYVSGLLREIAREFNSTSKAER